MFKEKQKLVKKLVENAKIEWVNERIRLVNNGKQSPKLYWSAINELKCGIVNSISSHPQVFKNSAGKVAASPVENQKIVKNTSRNYTITVLFQLICLLSTN